MTGPLALHGGGEFLAGDEPFLRRLLDLAAEAAAARGGATDAIRVELVTTAIARHRPDMTFAVGSAALERVATEAADAGVRGRLHVRHAKVVDATSAGDREIAERLASADLVYLPGGDPDAVVEILGGTDALRAIEAARLRGAVVAGASAGAMSMGEQTWTRDGYISAFGWAGRLAVMPHATELPARYRAVADALPHGEGLAIVAIPERVGVIGGPAEGWTVVGAEGVWWWPPHAAAPTFHPPGSTIRP